MATMTINVDGNPIVPCGSNLTATGGAGIYELVLSIGSGLGNTGITYDSLSIPDRFEIYYNNIKVIDSKFVGDSITDLTPTGGITYGNYTLNNFEYNGSVFVPTGTTTNITISSSDVSDNITEPTTGNGTILFNKTTIEPTTIRIVATGNPSSSTSWNIKGICPISDEDLIAGTEKFIYHFFTEIDKGLQSRSAKFVLGDSPVKFYTDRLGNVNFNNYGYMSSVQYINDTITWWRIDATGNILDTGLL